MTDNVPTTGTIGEAVTNSEIQMLTARASELRAAYVRSLLPAARRGIAAAVRALVRDRLRHPAAV